LSFEEDTYSSIFTALKHPIRRNILRRLSTSSATYTELLNEIDIDNGLLNYHLDNMRELIRKRKDGTYTLSEFGKAGLNLIHRIEEPAVKAEDKRRLRLAGTVTAIIIIALITCIGFLYSDNFGLRTLANDRMSNINQLQVSFDATNKSLVDSELKLKLLHTNYLNLLTSNVTPPVSKLEAVGIALSKSGWNSTSLKDKEVSATLIYASFFYSDVGSSFRTVYEVNTNLGDYSPKVEYNVTDPHMTPQRKGTMWYRYVWRVVISNQGFWKSIPPSGQYCVDASTGELFAFDHLF